MHDIQAHFNRLLGEWVSDESLRAHWREFLHGGAAAPTAPRLPPPPLFKGRTVAGAMIEIRPASDGYDVIVDGARVDHNNVPWHLDPDMRGPVQIGDHACEETFDAPDFTVRALATFCADHGAFPWQWARELLEDGLIDADLAITSRGKRCLERSHPVHEPASHVRNHCVLVADAARARVWALDMDRSGGTAISELVEVAEITNPTLRARNVELVSDSGTGRRGGARTPLHATPDHRDHHRRDLERHFAAQAAEEAVAVSQRYPSCELVVVASPVMLGLLRPALHDLLAGDKLLPERGRRAPVVPVAGLPTAPG